VLPRRNHTTLTKTTTKKIPSSAGHYTPFTNTGGGAGSLPIASQCAVILHPCPSRNKSSERRVTNQEQNLRKAPWWGDAVSHPAD